MDLDALCIHECSILGEEGELWPAPTFVVTALDRPDEPLVGKSCTACWSAVSALGCEGLPGAVGWDAACAAPWPAC